jgi:transcriptional regulator with XRE-family HTH domain
MHYTQRLKDLREDKELKQEAIAIVLKITRQQYQLYESGKRKLPIDLLITLCRFYNVSADYILGFTNTFKELPKK